MTALGMDVACDVCKGDPEVCETEQQKNFKADKMLQTLLMISVTRQIAEN